FEIESSKELASQRDIHGNLKICAKATIESGESTEICRSINKLDLDYPAEPVIVANVEYPVLEIFGISNGSLSITFDNRSDITNYVSFNGTDWNVYTGSEQIIGNTIYAKSVKNASGLSTTATQTVESISADALPMTAYNGDTTDETVPGTYYLKLGDSIKGDEFEIYWNDDSSNSSAVIKFWFADASKTAISGTTVTLAGNVGDKVNRYTVNSDASYLVVKPGHQVWATVREIKPVNEAVITSPDYDYPVWNIDGSVVYDTIHAEIAYQPESRQNLYKIDDGEWANYTGLVVVPLNSTIYAKSVFANGVVSPVTSFEAAPIEDALPQNAYNNDTTDFIPSGTHYLKLGDSLKNKKFDIFWVDTSSNSNCKVSFYYADASKTTISGTTVTLGNLAGEKMNTYTINPDAQYIVFSTYWPEYCTVREVRPVNYPEVTLHDYNYPVWRADGSITYDPVHAELAYESTSSQKLYKIDDGEWTNYTNRFDISVGSTIYAKSVFANGMVSPITTYSIDPVSDALPATAYNGDTTDETVPGTYYLRLSDEVKGKQFRIYWNDDSSNSSAVIKFWFADSDKTTISNTTVTLAGNVGDKVDTYTINSDASYLVLKPGHQVWATVREIQLIN
nr:hypothetical protein [Bacilli bacterium]